MSDFKFRRQYLKKIHDRYQKASKKEKGEILEEFIRTCKYNRKYAIRLLNQPLEDSLKPRKKRSCFYSSKALKTLESIWQAAGYPWSVRLKALLPVWMLWARTRYGIDPETERELLSISARQMDRRLGPKRWKIKKRIYGTTKPGSLLKCQIPIRTKNWDIKKAGFLEIDTVAHCGNSLDGDFVYTLNATDIHTTWVESVAVLGKGSAGIQAGVEEIRKRLPFRLRAIDSDNGSEFINYSLLDYCRKFRPRLGFTHSRPYEKEDQGHIEQKNNTHVRKIFGWDRYESPEALRAMNELYRNELHLWHNLFQPSVKLKKKIRKGSKIIRRYGLAQTPFQRVLACKQADPEKVTELKQLFAMVDPFDLSEHIDQELGRLYRMACQRVGGKIGFKPFQKQAQDAPHFKEKGPVRIPTSRRSSFAWGNRPLNRKGWRRKALMDQTLKARAA